jgi:hypothetical protein
MYSVSNRLSHARLRFFDFSIEHSPCTMPMYFLWNHSCHLQSHHIATSFLPPLFSTLDIGIFSFLHYVSNDWHFDCYLYVYVFCYLNFISTNSSTYTIHWSHFFLLLCDAYTKVTFLETACHIVYCILSKYSSVTFQFFVSVILLAVTAVWLYKTVSANCVVGDTEGTTSLSADYGKEVELICTLCTVDSCYY